MRKSRWPSWACVHNSPYGLCGHQATTSDEEEEEEEDEEEEIVLLRIRAVQCAAIFALRQGNQKEAGS